LTFSGALAAVFVSPALGLTSSRWERRCVAVAAEISFKRTLGEELLGVVLRCRVTGCPGGGIRRLAHREPLAAVGGPEPGRVLAGLAAQDGDPVRDHEGRIEADAEMADQLDVAALPPALPPR
jgi:hypothetical protein